MTKKQEHFAACAVTMLILALLGALWAAYGHYTADIAKMEAVLKTSGYTSITHEGSAWLNCHQSTYAEAFNATDLNGAPAEVVVCGGLFEAMAVRVR